jgi:hypothetical protein
MTCRHDLDNIVLEKLEDTSTMHAVYELEALVLTGEQPLFMIIGRKMYIVHLYPNTRFITSFSGHQPLKDQEAQIGHHAFFSSFE